MWYVFVAKSKITVMGIDAAAVNSGVCIIEASPIKAEPHISYNLVYEAGLVHGPKNDHRERSKFADIVKGLVLLHGVELVVVEDYISRGGATNTSAYEHGETVGQLKKAFWEIGIPLMIVGPTQMRSFVEVPSKLSDSGKQFIVDACKETYGFESAMTNQNKRSNASDAFMYCVIGSVTFFYCNGESIGPLSEAKSKVILGDGKKSVGLINSPQYFYNCSWLPEKPL